MEEKLMHNDRKGEKRPADVSGAPIQVGPVAKGDSEGRPSEAPNRDRDGQVGGAAQARAPTSARRKEIDKAAAAPRWEG